MVEFCVVCAGAQRSYLNYAMRIRYNSEFAYNTLEEPLVAGILQNGQALQYPLGDNRRVDVAVFPKLKPLVKFGIARR